MDRKKMFAGVLSTVLLASLGETALGESKRTYRIEKEITKTKLEYSAIYNQLNTDPQYDIVCPRSRGWRMCMPRYLDVARRKALKTTLSCSVYWEFATPGVALLNDKRCDFFRDSAFVATANAQEPGFRENAQQIVQQSPELQALRLKLEALEARR